MVSLKEVGPFPTHKRKLIQRFTFSQPKDKIGTDKETKKENG